MLLKNNAITKMAINAIKFSRNPMISSNVPTIQKRSKATLPDLPYDYSALEPVITAEIMQLHHSKHHQTYVNNFNVATDKLSEALDKGKVKLNLMQSGASHCFINQAICYSSVYFNAFPYSR